MPTRHGSSFAKKVLDLRTTEFAAEHLLAVGIDAVSVKNVLSYIETHCGWLHHLTSSISRPKTLPIFRPGDGCRPQHH
jgi:hypothetical protein